MVATGCLMISQTTSLKEAALHYHSQGLRIFPLPPGTRVPYKEHTLGDKLFKKAKANGLTEADIRSFWDSNPTANIGLFAGTKSGLSAIDIDVDELGDGNVRLAELGEKHGFNVLDGSGLVVLSPSSESGGRHLYWRYTDRLPRIFNRKSFTRSEKYGYGFDIRSSEDGYIVLPPSITTEGSYSFENGMEPTEFRVATLKRFPYEGPWFSLLPKRKTKRPDGPDKPDYWASKINRLIKEAKPFYDLLDKYLAQYEDYRGDKDPRKTITKKHVKAELATLEDSLKKKTILRLTDKRGTVLAKPDGHLLMWYPLDFTDSIQDTLDVKHRHNQWLFHSFNDGVTRAYWKSYDQEEPRWVRVNIGPTKRVTWQDILNHYL